MKELPHYRRFLLGFLAITVVVSVATADDRKLPDVLGVAHVNGRTTLVTAIS